MKISVKFRKRNNIPFAIERLSGTQYRCGACGNVFLTRPELDRHLRKEKNIAKNTVPKFPDFDEKITVHVLYTQDLRECTNQYFPKFAKGDEVLKIKR